MIKDRINILLTNEGQISGFRKLQELGFIVHHFPMIKQVFALFHQSNLQRPTKQIHRLVKQENI